MFFLLLLLISVILQVSLISHFKFFGVAPNLILLVALFSSWQKSLLGSHFIFGGKDEKKLKSIKNFKYFLVYGAVGGLLSDFFSGLPFGVFLLSFTLSFFLAFVLLRGRLGEFDSPTAVLFAVSATFLNSIFAFVLNYLAVYLRFSSYKMGTGEFFLKILPLEIILNIILSLLLFYVFRQFRKIFR